MNGSEEERYGGRQEDIRKTCQSLGFVALITTAFEMEISNLVQSFSCQQMNTNFLCIDHEKAFDSIEMNAVLESMEIQVAEAQCIKLFKRCELWMHNRYSSSIPIIKVPIEKGVKQGDTISPKLFTGREQLSRLRFANDME
ncbi:uncharacterized protein LOC115222659 [Octopus sinensis]|uniref:Uncharacterized protein LOC115222659 n=1 Tax=Octopus sinensis TaxID=2607531 RepID=A0A6P7TCL7_9MOLL|nr:uncharacterized protein LOC115222659 [Octopus sinensis]